MKEEVVVKKRRHPYAIVHKSGLLDRRLSWRARGILAFALAFSGDPTTTFEFLLECAPDGRKSLRAGLHELQSFGYAKLRVLRGPDGRMNGQRWELFETPQVLTERPL